jgi:large conductance mechanosensitive channel
MLDGFKKFILRGNVVDMAVGVVIGAAFGGVVTALTKDLLTPLIARTRRQAGFFQSRISIRRTHFRSAISSMPASRSF